MPVARGNGRAAAASKAQKLNRFLEIFGGAEGDLLARLDLDRLAGRGIAAHASSALANLQNAQSGDPDPIAFLQMLATRVTRSASIVSACFFGTEWLSASLAARCLKVTVGDDVPWAVFFTGILNGSPFGRGILANANMLQ